MLLDHGMVTSMTDVTDRSDPGVIEARVLAWGRHVLVAKTI